ncbi:MAG: hypothetical protein ACRECD_09925 [Burkholderiaceae bacterium]
MTRFVDVPALSRLVQDIGGTPFIGELPDAIQEDFVRWPEFDKFARVANHSDIGVIELMPVSNAKSYAFKYVNGHPSNTARGLPWADDPKDLFRYTRTGASRAVMRRVA